MRDGIWQLGSREMRPWCLPAQLHLYMSRYFTPLREQPRNFTERACRRAVIVLSWASVEGHSCGSGIFELGFYLRGRLARGRDTMLPHLVTLRSATLKSMLGSQLAKVALPVAAYGMASTASRPLHFLLTPVVYVPGPYGPRR